MTVNFFADYIKFLEHKIDFSDLQLENLIIGISYTAASVDENVGVSYTLYDRRDQCCGHLTPKTFEDKTIKAMLELIQSNHPVKRSVAIAVANAVAVNCLKRDGSFELENKNFLDSIIQNSSKKTRIGMIGNIHPIVRHLTKQQYDLTILDVFDPVTDSSQIKLANSLDDLKEMDHLLVSGSALVFPDWEQVVMDLLPTIKHHKGLIGPSASVHPEFFFRYGFDIIAGSYNKKNQNSDIFNVVKLGGGYSYFKRYCKKFTFIKTKNY